MTWLGAGAVDRHPVFNPNGLQHGKSRDRIPSRKLARGTLHLDVVIPDQFRQPLDLIAYERHDRFRRSLHMVMGPNGRVWVATEAGQCLSVLSLDLARWPKNTPIRLSYSWDAIEGMCWIGAENLDSGAVLAARGGTCAPLYLEDLARILYGVTDRGMTEDVQSFAFADHIEPLGYSEGIAPGALVDTEFGPQPIERLKPGTLIATACGGVSPLLAHVCSHLPSIGSFAPLRLRRPFQNLHQTLDVTPRCEILTDGTDTAYLFGVDQVTVRAMHIAPFLPAAQRKIGIMSLRYNLVLADGQPFKVGGIHIMSLTQTHRDCDTALTRLRHLPAQAMSQRCETTPAALHRHEAIALMSERYL